ncbi:MAG: Hsp20/alpha crystallin family protein [Xanthomonadaceae bacterium]|nr:Hsp20/alpha crystallin family protein [Xanthomonadaceae bacterium]
MIFLLMRCVIKKSKNIKALQNLALWQVLCLVKGVRKQKNKQGDKKMNNLTETNRKSVKPATTFHNPFWGVSGIQRQINQIMETAAAFADLDNNWLGERVAFEPSCEITEGKTHYLLAMDVPGMKIEDINLQVGNGLLAVKAELKEKQNYRSFYRSFSVPLALKASQVEAEYQDGVLRIAFPKLEEAQAESVKIAKSAGTLVEKVLGKTSKETKKIN